MKRTTLLLAALFALLSLGAQEPTHTLKGQAVGPNGEPVGYATVLLAPAGEEYDPAKENHQGTSASTEGRFSFSAPEGNYTLTITFIGYKLWTQELSLTAPTDLGAITLEEDSQLIESVAITGGLIRREADRYVMSNLSESALAKGRDSYELLKLAPGVWADDNGSISINGKSGVKVLLNEREVRMTGDQLMAYLKALPAENLQKIEIIPESGADYDADSSAGIIKITLRRMRESGTNGSVTLGGTLSTLSQSYTVGPNGNINHKNGRWNLYGSFSLSSYSTTTTNDKMRLEERTSYANGAELLSHTSNNAKNNQGGGIVGAIYDLSERSSIGFEYNLWHSPAAPTTTASDLSYTLGADSEYHTSLYEQRRSTTNQSVAANYILALDDRGSRLKVIADWAGNATLGTNLNSNKLVRNIGGVASAPIDSLYRNSSVANYSYYTLTAAVEQKLSDATTLSYGAKYTLTDSYSTTDYSYLKGEEWTPLESYNSLTDYNEHIGALYGIYSTRFANGAALSAGLRAEYTNIPELKQQYVSLFPHLNISYPLNPTQTVILSGSYKRAITRPSFWTMNPVRQQLSEFSYQVGNPDLRPVYSNNFTLSATLFYRYTITLGGYLQDGVISQLSMVDDADPTGRTLKYIHTNINNLYQYYIQLSVPAQITPWWTMNANLLSVMLDQRIASSDTNDRTFTTQGYMVNTFSLPKGWSVDFTGQFVTDAKIGNLTQQGQGNISLAVKKQVGDKLSFGVGFNHILDTSHQRVFSSGEGFSRTLYSPNLWTRSVNLYVRYNFQAGKMFRAKSVESGAAEEKGRMGN
ncbi:MAG: TonB-dependent receptor family protein [Tidjanibacter sp.]|nr:TonB-dependent receptor family protein [Tidjanibacter sp.]